MPPGDARRAAILSDCNNYAYKIIMPAKVRSSQKLPPRKPDTAVLRPPHLIYIIPQIGGSCVCK